MSMREQIPIKPAATPGRPLTPAPFGTLQRKCACGGSAGAGGGSGQSGGDCPECKKKKETLHRYALGKTESATASPSVPDVLGSLGQPLDAATRTFREPRFGHDFRKVRVDDDSKAAESASAASAKSKTVSNQVVLGASAYAPGTNSPIATASPLPRARAAGGYTMSADSGNQDEPNTNKQAFAGQTSPVQTNPAGPPAAPGTATTQPGSLSMMTMARAAAPDGTGNDRQTVGPGELVDFIPQTLPGVVDFAGTPANWTATAGTPTSATAARTFTWAAPEPAGDATITATLTSSGQSVSTTIKTVAPSAVSVKKTSEDSIPAGTEGAGMMLSMTLQPLNVSFDNVQHLEDETPATGVSGYFKKVKQAGANLDHTGPARNPNWVSLNGNSLNDHAFWRVPTPRPTYLPPWEQGHYEWAIPTRYRATRPGFGVGGPGIVFTTVPETFDMLGTDGTVRVTKGSNGQAMVTRSPGGGQAPGANPTPNSPGANPAPKSPGGYLTPDNPLDLPPTENAAAPRQITPTPYGTLQRKCACGGSGGSGSGSGSSGGECDECKKKKKVMRRRGDYGDDPTTAPPLVNEVLRSPGQPLDSQTRAFFEPRFGYDFGKVRVHMDSRAAASSRAVGAAAYTVGSDIVFASGRYAPNTSAGRSLLAHELTHVVQQIPVLSRQAADPAPPTGKAQGNASNSLTNLASVIENYAQRADARLNSAGGGADVDDIRRNIGTARKGASALRQVAAKGDDRLSAGVLAKFTPANLKAASSGLAPANVQPPAVAVSESTPTAVATKSLEISHPQDTAELEADRVAAAVMSGRTVTSHFMPAELGVYRQLADPASQAFEEEEVVSGIREITKLGVETAAEETAVETAGATFLGLGPVGWAILAAVVVVVVVVAVGYYYYSKDDAAKQPAPSPSPAPAPSPSPSPSPTPAPSPSNVPQECAETVKRLNTDKCKMTATTQHSGGDPVADLFCEQVTHDPCEYRTNGASGTAYFDAIRGTDAYECKCGLLSKVQAAQRGEQWAIRAMDEALEQIRRHLRVVQDCGLQYRMIVSNDVVANYLRGELGNEVDVGVEKSEFCD